MKGRSRLDDDERAVTLGDQDEPILYGTLIDNGIIIIKSFATTR
jgi:predicted RNA polymerase sigma factor